MLQLLFSLPLDQRISLSVELKTTQANKQATNKQTPPSHSQRLLPLVLHTRCPRS